MSVAVIDVGVAVRTVDVPVGTAMAGFAARLGPSVGVRDPLSVRALALDTTVLVVIDCCALHEDTCDAVRARVATVVADSHVIVAATHTHSGPCIALGRLGPDQRSLTETVAAAGAAAALEALRTRVPCTVGYSEARGVGVAHDRRHLDRAIDPPVQVLAFVDGGGTRRATFVSYPCHPVVLNAANRLISADFIHPLRASVESAYPRSVCVYATGAAGDVNTGHSATASFHAEDTSGRDFPTARRLGLRIADAAVRAPLTMVESHTVLFQHHSVTLDFQPVDLTRLGRDIDTWSHEFVDAEPDRRALLDSWLAWARAMRNSESMPQTWTGEVNCVRLGPVTIVTLPGEPFLAAAAELQAAIEGPVIVLGYVDGVPGYLPDRAAYLEGGYEVADAHRYYGMPAPFVEGSLERLVECAKSLTAEGR